MEIRERKEDKNSLKLIHKIYYSELSESRCLPLATGNKNDYNAKKKKKISTARGPRFKCKGWRELRIRLNSSLTFSFQIFQ